MSVSTAPTRNPVDSVTIPLVTVLDERGRPDALATRPLLSHLAAGGITTLMLAGTNGEGPALAPDAVRAYTIEVGALWRDLVGPPARVMATAAGAGTGDMLARLDRLADLDLDAVVVLAPFYFRHTEQELYAHFRQAAGHGQPVIVYNSPGYTGNPLTLSLMRRLLDEPNIIGLKDSSGNAELFASFCAAGRDRAGFGVAQGAERLLADGVRHGAAGLVPGVGMFAPGLCVELLDLARRGDHAGAALAQRNVDRLTAIFTVRPGASGVVAVKTALALLGLAPAHATAPFAPYDESEVAALRETLAGLSEVLPVAVSGGGDRDGVSVH